VRHRLWAILDEMAMTLIRTSGNPSITDAHDFMVALFTPEGDIVLGGWGANRHVSCTAQAVKGILARFPEGSIQEDDVFLLNDPYVAAIHQQDVYLITPIHFDGALVGWTVNFTHLADVGGIDPGSSPRATEVIQEGLRIPGLKIADRGVLRQDVWDTLLTMTREPQMNALQLKAQVAANHTGQQKLRELLGRIGLPAYQTIVVRMMAHSEQALRARLRQLPDGTWHTREYLDTSERVYTVELAMTKRGDQLCFDFTGTSPQAASFINCTFWGTRGGVFVSMAHLLGYGLAWNEGLLKPLELVVPEGSLLNCTYPAPVSMSTVAASRLATIASWNTLASMVGTHEELGEDVSAPWGTGANGLRLAGVNRQQRYFVLTTWADTGGGGARPWADGIDTSGGTDTPMGAIPNIEVLERSAPILYLFRRQVRDAGGPGATRGGVSAEVAFTVHGAPSGSLLGVLLGTGVEPAHTYGLFGGYPGCNTSFALRQGTTIQSLLARTLPSDLGELGGTTETLPPQGLFTMDQHSVFYSRADSGGGLGDPLLRPPEKVLADVQAGLVSERQARDCYGVVADPGLGTVDAVATDERRRQIRASRVARAVETLKEVQGGARGVGPVRYDWERGRVACAACGSDLAALEEDWKARATVQEAPLASLAGLWPSQHFVLRSFACDACGTLLDAEMTRPTDPSLRSFTLSP
jgi:N-methylhydantoinase B